MYIQIKQAHGVINPKKLAEYFVGLLENRFVSYELRTMVKNTKQNNELDKLEYSYEFYLSSENKEVINDIITVLTNDENYYARLIMGLMLKQIYTI